MNSIIEVNECLGFIGETFKVGDYVKDFWYITNIEGRITKMFKAGNYYYISVYNKNEDKTYMEVNSLIFVSKNWFQNVWSKLDMEEQDKLRKKRDDLIDVKSCVSLDKIRGKHEYIEATDIDGIQLAVGMFLKNAFLSEEDKYRYVIEKDPKTNKIYLLGWGTGLPHVKREVEYAKDNLQVMYRYSNINSKEVKLQIIFNN